MESGGMSRDAVVILEHSKQLETMLSDVERTNIV